MIYGQKIFWNILQKQVFNFEEDNKIANEFWENNLDKVEIVKLQNDDIYLHDFIKDKYERKKFAKKGRDPFSLILEGKEPEKKEVVIDNK